MKKIIASGLIAASALALTAGAASAQDYRGYDRGWTPISMRQDQLEQRIDRGVETGQLSRREAWRLRSEARDIARLEARYRVNGLSAWERNDLNRRFDALSSQIRNERHDRDYGYGYYR